MTPHSNDVMGQAVDRAAFAQHSALQDGIRRYQAHPYQREADDMPVIWQEGSSRIYDYGALAANCPKGAILLVPSLINRGYILDLNRKRSFARFLATQGYRPLLLDWGYPGADERDFGLDDFIAGRLVMAVQDMAEMYGGPLPVVGYCMGGVLAMAACLLEPALVSRLVLLATPWDFMAAGPTQARIAAAFAPTLPHMLSVHDELPVDVLQTLFASLDPFNIGEKFRRFAAMKPDSPKAEDFVALEDWLNDGVPLTRNVAVDCLIGWYVENRPARGQWAIDDMTIDPAAIRCPTLVVIPSNDRIVPPESALALYDKLNVDIRTAHRPAAGHIGMMVGSRAQSSTWQPVVDWLAES
ncbi:poly-beta-hydroxybutyrate polymerase [Thalassospira profundimaris]|uniref:Poly-beta-hydroxybutyrate polymerase n=2 Tax=Thalassospira profundimaris TaxID=502049 RepID=A0A367WNP0_9PROT|nr:poly-beta-hydroxybutyrate polymerase [Thalassospira profundimaris]